MSLTKEELTDVRTAWQRLNRATSYLVGPIFDGTPESRAEVGRLVDECRQALTIILLTSGPEAAIDLDAGEKLDLETLRHKGGIASSTRDPDYLKQKVEAETLNRVRALGTAEDEDGKYPAWIRRDASNRLWIEDDATPGLDGHEDLSDAWKRLFGEEYIRSNAIEDYDAGDAVFALFSDGRIAIASYPGNGEIRRLK